MKMIFETFVCFRDGPAEYGFVFKWVDPDNYISGEDDVDSAFDLVLGATDDGDKMQAAWESNQWAAEAICVAANARGFQG